MVKESREREREEERVTQKQQGESVRIKESDGSDGTKAGNKHSKSCRDEETVNIKKTDGILLKKKVLGDGQCICLLEAAL